MMSYLRRRFARWIRQRQGVDKLPLTLLRRRLYIVPTRAGSGFGLLLLLMLLAGLNYANSIALFLTFLLIGFTLVTMHQCHRNLLGTGILAMTAHPTFAGRDGVLSLCFDNPGAATRFRIAAGVGDASTVTIDLTAHCKENIELSVAAPARGIVRLERVRLMTTHPFGLFRTWTWIHAPMEMIVYPRPRGTLPMPRHAGGKSGAHSRINTGADEWLGLRPFRDGDSPRQVDWKAYARAAPLLVKEYSAMGSALRLFHYSALGTLPTEARLEQLARWIVDAEAAGERYGVWLPATQINPDRGPEHRHRCLTALAVHALEGAARDGPTHG
jgi:uncharacterized protein (DUF58 family)